MLKYFIIILLIYSNFATASKITANVSFQELRGDYHNSSNRDSMKSNAIFINTSYYEKYNLTFGYYDTNVKSLDNEPDIYQNEYYFNLTATAFLNNNKKISDDISYYFYPGSISYGLSFFQIKNNNNNVLMNPPPPGPASRRRIKNINSIDERNASAIAYSINYLSNTKTFLIGINTSNASYDLPSLEITQLSPKIGFSLFNSYTWLQYTNHLLFYSDISQTGQESNSSAHEIRVKQFLKPNHIVIPDQIEVTFLKGKRYYAVSYDSGQMVNINHEEKESLIYSLGWKLNDQTTLNSGMFKNTFRNSAIDETYTLKGIYLSISTNINFLKPENMR